MKLRMIGLLAAMAILGSSAGLWAGEPNVADLTKEFKGEKPAAERTPEQLAAAYVKVVDALVPDMGAEDMGKRGGAQSTLERIAFHACRPGAEADRLACAKALAGQLTDDVPAAARVWIIRQLERIGRAEAVSQLAKALDDKDLLVRESARRALLKNSSKEANAALLAALAAAKAPDWRVAVINALAEKRDPGNVEALLKDAGSEDDAVRTAAICALAKAADKAAVEAVAAGMTKGSDLSKRIATDAYLLLADGLAAKDDKATALGIYKKMLAAQGHMKCAGIIGVARAGGVADLPTIFDALADVDARVRGSGADALAMMPGKDVTDAIVAKFKAAGAPIKPTLLRALAQRGDKAAAPVFAAAAEDEDEAVRVEALRGLGVVGDASAVALLLKAAAATGACQEAAREALARIPAADVDKALMAAIDEKDTKLRAEVIRALSVRHVTAAGPSLLKAAEDADNTVRNEAIKAVGAVAGMDSMPAVVAILVKVTDDASRNEAGNALIRIAGRESDADKRIEPILTALGPATGPAKTMLFSVLGRLGGAKALQAVQAALKDSDAQVKEAAVRSLADWPDAASAADLLDVAKSATDEKLQVLAIRGCIRVMRIQNSRPAAENAKMLVAALETAKRAEEKKQALGGLAECRDILAFQAVVPCMGDEALKEEAAQAAVRIARDIWQKNLEPVEAAMKKVLEVSKNKDACKQAQEVLDQIDKKKASK
jgi:HEAT repeat protein